MRSEMQMSLFKNEFSRFFALGFLGGAALVVATISLDGSNDLAAGIVPPAEAAVAQ
ncbi:hypothetical protein [Novosphingobium sp. M1R2S20]|uniref:Uncharacterized protein n=1 Tax=Novosphingobium rhizovicinum TaxID=3228928 RepID=A0ABV3RAD5_9SPHN